MNSSYSFFAKSKKPLCVLAVLHENVHGSNLVFALYRKLFNLQTFAIWQNCLFFDALSNDDHLKSVAVDFTKMHFGPKIGPQS